MSENHKKICRILNCFEYFLIFISAVGGRVSMSVFVSLAGIPWRHYDFCCRIKIFATTAGIKKYK